MLSSDTLYYEVLFQSDGVLGYARVALPKWFPHRASARSQELAELATLKALAADPQLAVGKELRGLEESLSLFAADSLPKIRAKPSNRIQFQKTTKDEPR